MLISCCSGLLVSNIGSGTDLAKMLCLESHVSFIIFITNYSMFKYTGSPTLVPSSRNTLLSMSSFMH
jgi:hypothetical protein